jgi:hypothetical protein
LKILEAQLIVAKAKAAKKAAKSLKAIKTQSFSSTDRSAG